jgi:hypothetical protein
MPDTCDLIYCNPILDMPTPDVGTWIVGSKVELQYGNKRIPDLCATTTFDIALSLA